MLLGIFFALMTERRKGTFSFFVEFMICIPLFLPPTAFGFYLLNALGKSSLFGMAFSGIFSESLIFTPAAAVIAAGAAALPITYKSIKSFLEYIDPEVLNAAKLDGAGKFQLMCFIQLPLARKGIIIALLLAFLRALGEFGVTSMIAGNIPGSTQTMSLAIWDCVMSGNMANAHILSGILAIFSLGVIIALRILDDRETNYHA
jgi:molybdate transport system permease protein